MDQLAAIRTFIRIVEAGSITKAAASLDMPKSTASKLLADLESHLGTKLLLRSTRSITVTPEGSAYYEQVSQVVGRLDDADLSLRDRSSDPKGRVRVDVHSSMAISILIPALGEFRAKYPDIQLVIGISDRPVGLIEEGVDCVVRLGRLPDTTLISKTIYEDRLVTCASPDYLDAYGTPKTPGDLAEKHILVGYFSALTRARWALTFRNGAHTSEIEPGGPITNDSAGLAEMVVQGLGIGQLYRSTVADQIAAGALVPILTDWTMATAPISILYAPSKKLNLRTRLFIDWLSSHLNDRFGRTTGKTVRVDGSDGAGH